MKMGNKPKAEGPCCTRRSRLYVTVLLSAMTLVCPLIPTRAQNTAGQIAGHSDQAASTNADASQRKADSGIGTVEAALIAALASGFGHFDAAIDAYHRSIDLGFRSFIPYVDLAAAYALQGRMEDAKTALTEARHLDPQLTVKWLRSVAPNIPNLFEGARKAGLPEE
jgi:tetratricopeptide (TPR) repeat protein